MMRSFIKRMHRPLSLFICALLVLSLVPLTPVFGAAVEAQAQAGTQANDQTLIIHYQRPAKDYEGWDLWLWEEGKEGKAIAFSGEDAYGKFWRMDNLPLAKFGFIVRKGNWEAKDVATDRFVDLKALSSEGISEVWLKQDQEAIETVAPEQGENTAAPALGPAPGSVTLKIHYRRFDNQYDTWNLWVWPRNQEGKAYNFTGSDDFGMVAEIPMDDLEGISEVGMIVRKGEWEQKDIDSDRYISLSKVDANGVLDVYVVQGTESLYYSLGDIDLSPRFMKAQLIDDKALKLTTSMPIKKADIRAQFSIVGTSGHRLAPAGVSASGDVASEFVITFKEAVHIGEAYETSYGTYKPLALDLSGLYDTEAFEDRYGYTGPLGALYAKESTSFAVWSPVAAEMTLKLYHEGHGGAAYKEVPMVQGQKGEWTAKVAGDLAGKYYTYTITYPMGTSGDIVRKETYDPYAISAGVNGDRSMVTAIEALLPEGFGSAAIPKYEKANDIVVYEIHIRDLTQHESSGAQNKGKYLGLVETGTQYQGVATGLDHIKDLGVTHVQILPMYDYNSIDETRLEDNQFNWGYDPKNYSVPEGSYSTNPYDGRVRVRELAQMVEGLHASGIGVIMDVVYNHTALSADSNLDILVPGYYYRMVGGKFSNGSGTGNETASERFMVRRLMVDSLKHWVSAYNIDGFRFDLMGVHDTETMALIEQELRAIKPDIILYGEGWSGGTVALPEAQRLVKKNIYQVPGIGAFNDDFRDAIKGHVFEAQAPGFVAGALGFTESLKFGFVGAGDHPQIKYSAINYSKKAWTQNPSQSVNYVSAHDNLTLWDKLLVTAPDATEADHIRMHNLANAMVLTSQGMPFLHAGVEMRRTKEGDHNSYKSPDAINNINWQWKLDAADTNAYYKGLIALRKAYPQLRLATAEAVAQRLQFFEAKPESWIQLPDSDQVIGFRIAPIANDKNQETLVLLFNASPDTINLNLPEGQYQVLANADTAGTTPLATLTGGPLALPSTSATILTYQEATTSTFNPLFLLIGGVFLWFAQKIIRKAVKRSKN